MWTTVAQLSSLLAGVVLLLMGAGLMSTLLSLRAGLAGFGDGWLGLIMSSYFAGFFFGTFGAPILIRRVGHVRSFAFCAALVSCLTLSHGLIVDEWAWLIFRGLVGAALVTLYTIIESWLNAQAPAERRGEVFAVYMVANLGALAAGQQLLRLGNADGMALFALVSILVCLSVLPVTWTRLAQPAVSNAPRMSVARLYRAAPAAALGAGLSGLAMGAFWGMTPSFASGLGLGGAQIANLMTATIIGGAAFQFPLGRYSDHRDRRQALGLIGACAGAAAALAAGCAALGWGLPVAMFVFGGFAFAVYPVCAAHLIDQLGRDEVLAGTGTLLLTHGVAAAFGPLVAGYLMEFNGPIALPLFFSATFAVLAALVLGRKVVQRPVEEQPAHFVPMLRTTPEALALIPTEDLPQAGSRLPDRPV